MALTTPIQPTPAIQPSAGSDSAASADALCMQCGLCCDGTFYGSVVIAADERERLGRVGLAVLQHADASLTMAQPCVALRGRLCSVYSERPAACAKYQCTLRESVAAGEASLEEGLARVARMQALLETIRVGFDCPPSTSIWECILALAEPTTPEGARIAARDYAGAINAVSELLELGRATFEPKFAGGGTR
jgi:Fe-S-cluster containining protein